MRAYVEVVISNTIRNSDRPLYLNEVQDALYDLSPHAIEIVLTDLKLAGAITTDCKGRYHIVPAFERKDVATLLQHICS
jgi:hypothetical protein